MTTTTSDNSDLRAHADAIVKSGALGRSRSYARLLEFLVACSLEGRTPKELEIAMEVFGKGADFDPSQDSLVRVYAHNLRQKLDQYYSAPGRGADGRLVLARGEYRISWTPAEVADTSGRASAELGAPAAAAQTGGAAPVAVAPDGATAGVGAMTGIDRAAGSTAATGPPTAGVLATGGTSAMAGTGAAARAGETADPAAMAGGGATAAAESAAARRSPGVEPSATAVAPAGHAAGGPRLASRGETSSIAPRPVAAWQSSLLAWWPVAAAALLALGGLGGWLAAGAQRGEAPLSAAAAVAASPVWAPFFDDDLPILVVVGDYFIFGELDQHGDVTRLVREFAVNSSRELDELVMYQPDRLDHYLDLHLTYLPRGSAFALLDLLRVLHMTEKPMRAVLMSELNVADVKSNHVVYVGWLSALDKLESFVFASSGLEIGDSYDELRNRASGELFASSAGFLEPNRNYRDYSFVSTFPGPGGNQLMIVAGTQDAGLMQSAHMLSDPAYVRAVEHSMPEPGTASHAFEQVYEVMGFDRTNLDAMLVFSGPLNYQKIWGGNLLTMD